MCGDDKGRLWTYHVTNLQKNSFQSGKPIQPTEVSVSSKCPVTYNINIVGAGSNNLFFSVSMITLHSPNELLRSGNMANFLKISQTEKNTESANQAHCKQTWGAVNIHCSFIDQLSGSTAVITAGFPVQ